MYVCIYDMNIVRAGKLYSVTYKEAASKCKARGGNLPLPLHAMCAPPKSMYVCMYACRPLGQGGYAV